LGVGREKKEGKKSEGGDELEPRPKTPEKKKQRDRCPREAIHSQGKKMDRMKRRVQGSHTERWTFKHLQNPRLRKKATLLNEAKKIFFTNHRARSSQKMLKGEGEWWGGGKPLHCARPVGTGVCHGLKDPRERIGVAAELELLLERSERNRNFVKQRKAALLERGGRKDEPALMIRKSVQKRRNPISKGGKRYLLSPGTAGTTTLISWEEGNTSCGQNGRHSKKTLDIARKGSHRLF